MIIAITGTNGAGKGSVVEYLIQLGFAHYSARAHLIEELERRGVTINRPALQSLGNELRQAHGPAYLARALYERAQAASGDAVIESIRAIAEAEFLKRAGVILLAVDADRHTRYERVVRRGSATDKVDFDTWVVEEEREWHNEAAHDMNIPAVVAMADYTILNNGTLEELHAQVDAMLKKLTQ
jgi:dephospho-CoA kinase